MSFKRFILLLDDIWKRVDLKEMGVPILSLGVASKVLFTTRLRDICGYMNAHVTVKVECVSPDKARKLFQANVGQQTLTSHYDIPALAKIMANECDCLPLYSLPLAEPWLSRRHLKSGSMQLIC